MSDDSIAGLFKATQALVLVLDRVPGRTDSRWDTGGIYAVGNWVADELRPAMPSGHGAALVSSMCPLLYDDTDQVFTPVDNFAAIKAARDRRKVYHAVTVSPTLLEVSGNVVGFCLSPPEWGDNVPPIIPIQATL